MPGTGSTMGNKSGKVSALLPLLLNAVSDVGNFSKYVAWIT